MKAGYWERTFKAIWDNTIACIQASMFSLYSVGVLVTYRYLCGTP